MDHISRYDAGDFLEAMQFLILNNELNSTYKLALIMTITEAALALDPHDDKPQTISFTDISRRFLRLYWHHGAPYLLDRQREGVQEHVLVQTINTTGNLKILKLIEAFKDGRDMTFNQASRLPDFTKLVNQCRSVVVEKNPLTYLNGFDFFFRLNKAEKTIELDPTVIGLLHRYHPMIIELTQYRWQEHLRKLKPNAPVLAESRTGTLREFLFENETRDNLAKVREILIELGLAKHCFYCHKPLGQKQFDVDHFLPFNRFHPLVLSNFVAACPNCNRSKSDSLAGLEFKEAWEARNRERANEFRTQEDKAQIPYGDVITKRHGARLYAQAMRHNETLWHPIVK